jgi:SdrD B-like domain
VAPTPVPAPVIFATPTIAVKPEPTVPSTPAVSAVAGEPLPTSPPVSSIKSAETPATTAPLLASAPAAPSIRQKVWEDKNRNGVQDPGEDPIVGAKVTLTLPDGSVLSARTNASGVFEFANLTPGDYDVEVLATDKPTNGAIKRKLSVKGVQVASDPAADFGFALAKSVPVKGDDLAFTGASSRNLAMVASAMLLAGVALLKPRRRVVKTAKRTW